MLRVTYSNYDLQKLSYKISNPLVTLQSYIKIITYQKNKVTSSVLVDSFLPNIIAYQKTKL